MGKPGPKKIHRYSVEFKLTAVKLSHMSGVEVQTVANPLEIHLHALAVAQGSPRGRRQGPEAEGGHALAIGP